jgi:hypothetical protein
VIVNGGRPRARSGQACDIDDPDRHSVSSRPRRERTRSQPRATGRQRHGTVHYCSGDQRQAASTAQGGGAEPEPRGGPVESDARSACDRAA